MTLIHDHIAQLEANIATAADAVRVAEEHVATVRAAIAETARLFLTDHDGSQARALEAAEMDLAAACAAHDAAKATHEDARARLATAMNLERDQAEKSREDEARAQRDAAQQRLDYLVKQLHLDEFPEVMRVRAEAVVAELVSMCQACYTHARERSEWASEARDLGDELGVKVQAAGDNDREYMVKIQRMVASTLESPAHQDFKWRKAVAGWLPDYDLRWLIGQWL